MKIYKSIYGQDADGNRGINIQEAELDYNSQEDKDMISERLSIYIEQNEIEDIEDLPTSLNFEYEGFEFSEPLRDWFDTKELQEFITEYLSAIDNIKAQDEVLI